MKKVLMVATIGNFLASFEISDMDILRSMGYEIHCAANFEGINETKKKSLVAVGAIMHQVDFGRSPFSSDNLHAYKQLKKLLEKDHFDIVHCHTPIGAAVGRIVAKKYRNLGTKVVYTCHGYHFHNKSPKKEWVIYYPLERILSAYTDMIITINREDFELTKKFGVSEVKYIPGVGIDTRKIKAIKCSREDILADFGIPSDAFVILTIGELSERKNQEVIIRALAELDDKSIYYLLCGNGKKEEQYKKLAEELGQKSNVIFAGYVDHDNVLQLCHAVDLGAIPSKIEGLGLAGLEILASGRPLIGSNVHGIRDYLIDGETGISIDPEDYKGFSYAINKMRTDSLFYNNVANNSQKIASKFDVGITKYLMRENYELLEKM